MASRADFKPVLAPNHRKVVLTGILTLGSSGAISSQDCDGFSVEKTATKTGRYTVTLTDTYVAYEFLAGNLEVAADAAVTDQKGFTVVSRDVGTTAARVAYLQCLGADSDGDAADREPIDSAKIRILIVANAGTC